MDQRDCLLRLLNFDYDAYQEATEGTSVKKINLNDPQSQPIISIGHGRCSDYLFVDIQSILKPKPVQAVLIHTSMNGLQERAKSSEPDSLRDFIEKSQEIVALGIGRKNASFEPFLDHSLSIAWKMQREITIIPSITFDSKAGWHSLIDLRRPDSVVIQMGGIFDGGAEYGGKLMPVNLQEHIQRHLVPPTPKPKVTQTITPFKRQFSLR
ncbi:MAG: hypothetical protein ACOYK8_05800 [Alphaproteobacteria bacterium]